MEYVIHLTWDNDANVWVATSDDIPGLVLESESFDALLERIRTAIPELLALNPSSGQSPLFLSFVSERHERMEGFRVLQSFAGTLPPDFDYKKELEEMREEKYARFS